jgi:hypothetical protein
MNLGAAVLSVFVAFLGPSRLGQYLNIDVTNHIKTLTLLF